MIGGVSSGIAARVGLDTTFVRLVLVLSVLLSGVGIAGYVLAWLLVPAEGEQVAIASRAVADRRGIALALALVPALTVVLVLASVLGAGWLSSLAWPLFIGAGGMVLVWRNASDAERPGMEQALGPLNVLGITGRHSRRRLVARIVLGLALAGTGLVLLTHGHATEGLARPIGGIVALAAGALVAFGPWWLNVARELVDERQARAVAEERADMAARLHDSVLQTLALIQRQAGDPQQVVKLARAQERELRGWLFEGRSPGSLGEEEATVAGAVGRIQRDVEDQHGVSVEAVVVGDCPLDEGLRALIEAGREATVNAAKWSGADKVSVFVEVQPSSVAMYVRDRGKGFDQATVAPDRKGLAESIRGRMHRHGGTVEVLSRPGEGTEVTLTMAPRDAAAPREERGSGAAHRGRRSGSGVSQARGASGGSAARRKAASAPADDGPGESGGESGGEDGVVRGGGSGKQAAAPGRGGTGR
jgi:signal transduction histidine kinase